MTTVMERTMLNRRKILGTSAIALLAAGMPRALAQAIKKPVHVMVGFPAGGGTDVTARVLAESLRGSYASTILVENKAGASARLAVEYVKNAEPDGSVMLFTPDFPMTLYPHSFKSLSYDPVRDFVSVAPVAKGMLTFVVGPAVPDSVRTLRDFVEWCKANPTKAAFATTSAGATPHFTGVMLANEAKVPINPVHYRGGAPAVQDLIGGHVPSSVNPVSEVIALAPVRQAADPGGDRLEALAVPAGRADHARGRLQRGGGFVHRCVPAGEDSGAGGARAEHGDRRRLQVEGDGRRARQVRQRAGLPDRRGIHRDHQVGDQSLGTGGEGVRLRGGRVSP